MVHTDAVQAAGATDITPSKLGVDLLSIAAHKLYGPKGVGLLYIKNRTPWQPMIFGGSQEKERRAGTENVPGAAGLATALKLACDEFEVRNQHSRRLRDRLLVGIPERIADTVITWPRRPEAAAFQTTSAAASATSRAKAFCLRSTWPDIAASSGSACTTGALEPSHVLTAMGIEPDLAHASLRLTVGKENTDAEIEYVLEALPGIVARLRALAGA